MSNKRKAEYVDLTLFDSDDDDEAVHRSRQARRAAVPSDAHVISLDSDDEDVAEASPQVPSAPAAAASSSAATVPAASLSSEATNVAAAAATSSAASTTNVAAAAAASSAASAAFPPLLPAPPTQRQPKKQRPVASTRDASLIALVDSCEKRNGTLDEHKLDQIEQALADGADAGRPLRYGVYGGTTAIHAAVTKGQPRVLLLLLTHGADQLSQSVNGVGEPPLIHLARLIGTNRDGFCDKVAPPTQVELARLLLEAAPTEQGRAEPDARDAKGGTALHYAAEYGALELVQLLLSKGADPSARNREESTPLQQALAWDKWADTAQIVALLLEQGADAAFALAQDWHLAPAVQAALEGRAFDGMPRTKREVHQAEAKAKAEAKAAAPTAASATAAKAKAATATDVQQAEEQKRHARREEALSAQRQRNEA